MKRILVFAMSLLTAVSISAQQKTMKAYMVADAHLDTQWNWDVQTTIRDHIRNTLQQNLMLLKKYPNYIFNFEGAVKYSWMKEYYPLEYEEMKKYIQNGRWHIAGSSWDANEVIIGSPESFLRNVLLGQTFYRKEFNTEGTDIFLPDCFGFPYTLPTLAAHCGLIGFSSQKLMWRTNPFYEGNRRYPFTIGLWQGIDGSRIMMAHGFNYSQRLKDEDISHSEMLTKEISEGQLSTVYRYYGTGDIGGSPTIPSVRAVEKGIVGDGPIQILSTTSDQLYRDYLPYENHPELPVFDGELTMDVHGNGCYTSQAAMKLYNRQNEHLGDAAERSAVVADWLGVSAYPAERLTQNWQRVIWHQFHDDVTGTSIPRAYEFSWNDELLALNTFGNIMTHSISAITRELNTQVSGQPVVVYNSEARPVTSIAEVSLDAAADYQVSGPDGRRVPSQVVMKDGRPCLLFEAQVPAAGFAVYSLKNSGKAKIPQAINLPSSQEGRVGSIENSCYRLTVNAHGDVVSLFDKKANRELVAQGKSLRLVVFDDCRSEAWPAWEIQKATLDKAPVPVHDDVQLKVEQGRLRQTLVISKRYGESLIVQRIHLYEGALASRIDFENEVDWHSLNALLKAEFPLSVSNAEATYDIGLGNVHRGNNRDNSFEVYAHEWTDLTDRSGSYGVTLLNDSRYGWDKPDDNTLRLSLLYSPKPAHNFAYQARQDFGHHVFTYSLVGHEGPLDAASAVAQADGLNSPLRAFVATPHKGQLGRTFSFVSSSNPNVVVRALKRAEVSDEYVIRVYELGGRTAQKADLTFAADIVKAVEADGTERTLGAAPFAGHSLQVDIKPFSVKTFKVQLAKPSIAVNRQSSAVSLQLPFDRSCATFNAFRSAADFEGGYSYAAELLPEGEFMVNGVPFQLGEKDAANGLSCRGNVIDLPGEANTARQLHLLVASDDDDRQATFTVGRSQQTVGVPFYSGFVGQWGHDGQTTGHLKDAEVAWVGSHRHSATGDEPYEYTYMFRVVLEIPKGVRQVQLPNDNHVVIFAATLTPAEAATVPAAPLFKTSFPAATTTALGNGAGATPSPTALKASLNLLKSATIVAVSGEVNHNERAALLVDGDDYTKWCDSQPAPNYVAFDLGKPTSISRWRMVNAASEQPSYVTRTCLLQGRNNPNEEWLTLDMFDGNRRNTVDRSFDPVEVRYVRIYVVNPTQGLDAAARIYELEVF